MREKGYSHTPAPLSDSQIGRITSPLGHEGKAGLVIKMTPGIVYQNAGLDGLLIKENKPNAWAKSVPFSWCKVSLEPNGLVEEVIDQQTGRPGYKLADEGNDLGVPYAGQSLTGISEKYQISLRKIGGESSTRPKERDTNDSENVPSTITRLRIFSELLQADQPVSEADLIQTFHTTYEYPTDRKGINRTRLFVQRHLHGLQKEGIITYKQGDEQDIVTKDTKLSGDTHSRYLSLTTRQREVVQDFTTIVESLRRRDPKFIAEGRRKAHELAADEERFAAIQRLGREAYPLKRRKNV